MSRLCFFRNLDTSILQENVKISYQSVVVNVVVSETGTPADRNMNKLIQQGSSANWLHEHHLHHLLDYNWRAFSNKQIELLCQNRYRKSVMHYTISLYSAADNHLDSHFNLIFFPL